MAGLGRQNVLCIIYYLPHVYYAINDVLNNFSLQVFVSDVLAKQAAAKKV